MIVSATVASAGGCATLIYGRSESVPVHSDPPGATVIVDGKPVGDTPLNVSLRRKDLHDVRIEKTGYIGYETTTVTKETSLVPTIEFVPMLLFLPTFPFAFTDYETGAGNEILPKSISVRLLKAPTQTVSDKSSASETESKAATAATPAAASPAATATATASFTLTATPTAAPTPSPDD